MNNLNRDVLDESTSEFRDQLLATTVATSRRVRRTRAIIRIAAASAASLLVALTITRQTLTERSSGISPSSASSAVNNNADSTAYAIILSVPFTNILRTTPLPLKDLLATESPIKTLDNTAHPVINPINDDQLLALFAGRPVALVLISSGEELILLETDPPISN
jgi:hypothetical protein